MFLISAYQGVRKKWGPSPFLGGKKMKGKRRKKRKSLKAETIKKLSPRSKCYCFSHSGASRIVKCSMAPPL